MFAVTPVRVGKANVRKGETHTRSPECMAWWDMVRACYDRRCTRYKEYGARGISVCKRWRKDYAAFLGDMGRRPGRDWRLARKDTDGDFTPKNCMWLPRKYASRLVRHARFISFEDHSAPLGYWAEEFGIPYKALVKRLRIGWSIERALTTPSARKKAA